jgi:flagellin FlaB
MEEWIKTLRWFARNKKAISGLETAIVLIAFVIVASAFAYAVLNMGFLATQKSQQVVLGGLGAASSALVVDGPVYGYSSQTPGPTAQITTLIFWLKTASGASSVDLNPAKTTISFQNPNGVWPNVYWCSDGSSDASNLKWGPSSSGDACGTYTAFTSSTSTNTVTVNGHNYVSEAQSTVLIWEVGTGMSITSGQKVRVTIDLKTLSTDALATAGYINPNDGFTIIVKPPVGSVLEITRTAPPEIGTVNDLG